VSTLDTGAADTRSGAFDALRYAAGPEYGMRHLAGDPLFDSAFSLFSPGELLRCKPINYALALEEHDERHVHAHVGREPSGHGFNELRLNNDGLPHNPMINAGAILCCSLLRPQLAIADRFDFIMDRWRALAGGAKAGFSNPTYLSERATADRNFALGYYMQERKAFPAGTNLVETLEFYFQCCSIEQTCASMSVVTATLANGGVCPVTGERVLRPKTVQHCLSLMSSCGMYDFSGEFAFSIGLPAKSGVAGAVMVVIPNVAGFCTWSPRLDRLGNSVRGIDFCKVMVERYKCHSCDSRTGLSEKRDPRRRAGETAMDLCTALTYAASKGDLSAGSMGEHPARRRAARRPHRGALGLRGAAPAASVRAPGVAGGPRAGRAPPDANGIHPAHVSGPRRAPGA
jgi:glutaminase